jgi:hypothetical protein
VNSLALAEIGTYWTQGYLETADGLRLEGYGTCARCGAFVNSEPHHEEWHRMIEGAR